MAIEMNPTAAEELYQEWKAKGRPFKIVERAYRSSVSLKFDVSDAGNGVAYLSLAAGTELTLFDYGLGDEIDDGLGGQRRATKADTNLGKAGYTNGGEDFAIESLSLTSVGWRIAQAAAVAPGNKTVIDAYAGKATICDPACIMAPPQLVSPFNLENAVFQAFIKQSSLEVDFDQGQRTIPMGGLDEIPEGGASSFLRANGEPHPSSRYRIPSGYKWMHAGEADCQFRCTIAVERGIVVPVTQITLPGGAAVSLPTGVCLDIAMRAHGKGFSAVNKN